MKHLYQILAIATLTGLYSCTGTRYAQQGSYNNQNNNTQQDYSQQDYSQQNNSQQDYSQQAGPITYQEFYNNLSPYGNWVNYEDYGYVWVPNAPDFRPYYSNGQWVYTDYGWTWSSNYNWGWAPFHYGRWIDDMAYGWMWVPGYEWAPAWVSWRGGGDYYGWAPLGPRMGVDISVGTIPQNNWAFVPRRYINSPQINNYYVDRSKNVTIINNTTIINNNTTINNNNTTIINKTNNRNTTIYNQGPSVTDVEKSTGNRIRKLSLVQSNKPGGALINSNAIRMYRPVVNTQTSNPTLIKPAKITNLQEIQSNRSNGINNSNPNIENQQPVRQFQVNQTPEIKRNGSPVNNTPVLSPNTIDRPIRRLPEPSKTPSMQTNRNLQPQNESNKNEPPVNNNPLKITQRNIAVPNNISRPNNLPANNSGSQPQPVRKFNNIQPLPPNNSNANGNRENLKIIQRNLPNRNPVIQNNRGNYQPNQKMVNENPRLNNVTPVPHIVKPADGEKKDGK